MDAPKSNLDLNNYIRDQLRQGRRYLHIKQKLMESGWLKEEIDQAFREILSYRTPQAKAYKRPRSNNFSLSPNAKKALTTVAIAVFLVVGVFFFLSGNVGQAIFFEKLIGGSKNATSGEVTYTVQCTPPHTLNPDRSGCCLDNNGNGKCDFLEKVEVVNVTKTPLQQECSDNSQCESKQCVNGKCGFLAQIYSQPLEGCTKVCNFYTVDLLTSDKESYSVKAGEGSYTGAGALNWKVLNAPPHCLNEVVQIPIEITRISPGKPSRSQIVTLMKGESSGILTHPGVPNLYFTLVVTDAYEVCENSLAELQVTLLKNRMQQTQLRVK